jgi:uncharacterized protein (TIGR02328 family)
MRLWDYRLIPYLPKSQLLAQWRELNSIFKKQDKHILINYLYAYEKKDLLIYSSLVWKEMIDRGYKIKKYDNFNKYFEEVNYVNENDEYPFKNHHTKQYLLQCFMNLEEKYFCGQKDFDRETYLKLWNFVNDELNGLLEEIGRELKC